MNKHNVTRIKVLTHDVVYCMKPMVWCRTATSAGISYWYNTETLLTSWVLPQDWESGDARISLSRPPGDTFIYFSDEVIAAGGMYFSEMIKLSEEHSSTHQKVVTNATLVPSAGEEEDDISGCFCNFLVTVLSVTNLCIALVLFMAVIFSERDLGVRGTSRYPQMDFGARAKCTIQFYINWVGTRGFNQTSLVFKIRPNQTVKPDQSKPDQTNRDMCIRCTSHFLRPCYLGTWLRFGVNYSETFPSFLQ